MTAGNGAGTQFTRETFKTAFTDLQGAILAEWPALDKQELAATAGELDEVIDLIAVKTEHTRTLVRRHIEELAKLAEGDLHPTTNGAKAGRAEKLIEAWQKRTRELAKELRENVLVNAQNKVKENVLVSVLVALGLGLLLGFLFGGMRRGRDS